MVGVLLVVLGLLCGCGDVVTHKSVFPGGQDVVLGGDVKVEMPVGPEGGVVGAGAVELNVPAGAVEGEVVVSVEQVSEYPKGALGPVYRIEVVGGELQQPVTVSLAYAPEELPAPYRYEDIKLAFVNSAGRWEILSGSVADKGSGTISGTTSHLSLWGLVPKVKLDILWVIDNSASMCQEQYGLSRVFDDFVGKLQSDFASLDVRVAVTTTNSLNDEIFVTEPAKTYPPACYESRTVVCETDAQCEEALGESWQCSSAALGQIYNMNMSVNSLCTFRCEESSQCCQEFCFLDECGDDLSCLDEECAGAPNDGCSFECVSPGQDPSVSGCLRPPDTQACPEGLPAILEMDEFPYFGCLAQVEPDQSYMASMEQGLKSAWRALDPAGPNSAAASEFIRPDAYLLVVFASDEDDCSIDRKFCSPNWTCLSDEDCPGGSTCEIDEAYSQFQGKEVHLCCGSIKKDYYNRCGLLGEYMGEQHHACAYDEDCDECADSGDCEEGWHCTSKKKCEPEDYDFSNPATYQSPPGYPLHSLAPVYEYYDLYRSLKPDSKLVMAAVITGDGLVAPGNEESLISPDCLADVALAECQTFSNAVQTASAQCLVSPGASGCEEFYGLKMACIRECYFASKGDSTNPALAGNTYICSSDHSGKADFGRRYIKLAELFGEHGSVTNICSPEAMGKAMDDIAGMVIGSILQ